MLELYINFWKQATDFKTRTNRSDYWTVMLIHTLVSLCVVLVFFWTPSVVRIFIIVSCVPMLGYRCKEIV
ncbi:hypothetical protein C1L36_01035 [Campylobacter coli]|nr:hypothetical protein [Campylobacter coli]